MDAPHERRESWRYTPALAGRAALNDLRGWPLPSVLEAK
jgi:hypothetical protein